MKKSAILLSLALVLVLSFGAAAQFSLSGVFEMDVTMRQKQTGTDADGLPEYEGFEFYGQTRQHISLALGNKTTTKGSLKLLLNFGAIAQGSSNANTWQPWTGIGNNPNNVNVQLNGGTARIEATGALWKGGQSLTTMLGRFSPNYSPWVASTGAKNPASNATQNAGLNGVEIRTLAVGPLNVRGYYGVTYNNGDYGQGEVFMLDVQGDLAGLKTQVTAVNREVIAKSVADRDHVWDIAAVLSTSPVAGVDLSGAIVIDGQGQGISGTVLPEVSNKLGLKADVKLTTIPNLTLTGNVYKYDEGFGPRYAQWNTGSGGYHTQFTTNRQGFKVGAETTQAGVKLNGSYENIENVAGADYAKSVITAGASTTIEAFDVSGSVSLADENDVKTTETKIGVGTKFSDVTVKYNGTIKKVGTADAAMKNEFTANTTMDLFFADKVAISAAVIHNAIDGRRDADGDVIMDYGIDAKWAAPNGLNFVVGYANYNKSGNNFVHKTNPDGFYVRATTSVSF